MAPSIHTSTWTLSTMFQFHEEMFQLMGIRVISGAWGSMAVPPFGACRVGEREEKAAFPISRELLCRHHVIVHAAGGPEVVNECWDIC